MSQHTSFKPVPPMVVAVREVRAGHDDVVWTLPELTVDSVHHMLAARIPGGPLRVHARDLAELLGENTYGWFNDSIYVVEAEPVRRQGHREILGNELVMVGAGTATRTQLDDITAIAEAVGIDSLFASDHTTPLRAFATALAVNGAATYLHEWKGSIGFTAVDPAALARVAS